MADIQTMIYKTLHKKLNIEQNFPLIKFWGELSFDYFIVERRYFYFFLVFKATFHNSLIYRHGQIIGGLHIPQ